MSPAGPLRFDTALAVAGRAATAASGLDSQKGPSPYHQAPWGQLPDGRDWGPLNGIFPDPDGECIWFADGFGRTPIPFNTQESCLLKPDVARIPQGDLEGNLLASFGEGLCVRPHGTFVDTGGNVWVTDHSPA